MTTQPDDAGPARVFLVDDHRVVRTGPAGHLATEPGMTVVGEASDGRQALDQLTVLHRSGALPDVVMAADVPLPVVPAPTPATGSSRAFAAARPDAVAGLVLVDATHEDEWTDRYPDAHRRGLALAACSRVPWPRRRPWASRSRRPGCPSCRWRGSTGCHRRTAPSSGVGGVGGVVPSVGCTARGPSGGQVASAASAAELGGHQPHCLLLSACGREVGTRDRARREPDVMITA